MNLGNLLLAIFPKHSPNILMFSFAHVHTHTHQLPTETGPQLLPAKSEPDVGRWFGQKQGHAAGRSRRSSCHLTAAGAGPALGRRRPDPTDPGSEMGGLKPSTPATPTQRPNQATGSRQDCGHIIPAEDGRCDDPGDPRSSSI